MASDDGARELAQLREDVTELSNKSQGLQEMIERNIETLVILTNDKNKLESKIKGNEEEIEDLKQNKMSGVEREMRRHNDGILVRMHALVNAMKQGIGDIMNNDDRKENRLKRIEEYVRQQQVQDKKRNLMDPKRIQPLKLSSQPFTAWRDDV